MLNMVAEADLGAYTIGLQARQLPDYSPAQSLERSGDMQLALNRNRLAFLALVSTLPA